MTSYLLIREWLAGAVLPLALTVTILIGVYLLNTWRREGPGWSRLPGVALACVMWWIFAAETLRSGFIWLGFRAINDGVAITDFQSDVLSLILAFTSLVLIFAMLRCAYLFTPLRWGSWVWISSALAALTLVTLGHVIPT